MYLSANGTLIKNKIFIGLKAMFSVIYNIEFYYKKCLAM